MIRQSSRLCPEHFFWVVCLLVLSGCGRHEENVSASARGPAPASPSLISVPADSPKLRQIRVEAVALTRVPVTEVVAPGRVELNPGRLSRVLLPLSGRIAEVLVKLGDTVTQGQPLLMLESPDADAAASAYLQAEAALRQAHANEIKAQSDYDRASDLWSQNAVAKKEVLNGENALAQAKAAVQQTEALREQSLRRLSLLGLKPGQFGQQVAVRASLAGKVLDISVTAGEYRNDTNAPLMTIADLSTVWVSSDVPEPYIRFIDVGERVEVELVAYPGEVFHGRVTRIADTVDPQTRTIRVRAEMDNSRGRFRPDMFGRMRHIDQLRSVAAIPPGAVVQNDGKTLIFVEKGPGQFEQREVTLGKRSGDLLPVEAGVKAGERVVTDGALLLKGGL